MTVMQLAEWAKGEAQGACEAFVRPPVGEDCQLCAGCGWTQQRHILREVADALYAWPVFPPAARAQLSADQRAMLDGLWHDPLFRAELCALSMAMLDMLLAFVTKRERELAPHAPSALATELLASMVVGMVIGWGPSYQDEATREQEIGLLLEAAHVGAQHASREAAAQALKELH